MDDVQGKSFSRDSSEGVASWGAEGKVSSGIQDAPPWIDGPKVIKKATYPEKVYVRRGALRTWLIDNDPVELCQPAQLITEMAEYRLARMIYVTRNVTVETASE